MGKKGFVLLKQSYPTSRKNRPCDGFTWVMENLSEEERTKRGLTENELEKNINEGETYLYRVGKEDGVFKTQYYNLKNFELIRINLMGYND
jgi:hypothetical protein